MLTVLATSLRASRREDNEDNDVDAAVQPQQPTDAEMDAL
ncbi:MAG: hypothetical protein ACI970_001500 [Myxococcota bacterium]|jgi:hypothetical protein